MDAAILNKKPIRTCVGCREKDTPENLLRIVKIASQQNGEQTGNHCAPARVEFDPNQNTPGRGAWVHQSSNCLKLAISKGGIRRSFKLPVDATPLTKALQLDTESLVRKIRL